MTSGGARGGAVSSGTALQAGGSEGSIVDGVIGVNSASDRNNKVKFSRYRPGVAQRVGRGIALLLYDRSTRRG